MKTPESGKSFEKHLELFRTSKLSKAKYCRENRLSYHQFNYWLRKKLKPLSTLVPIQLKSSVQPNLEYIDQPSKVLCTLDLGQNGCLKIYDIQVMASILERLV